MSGENGGLALSRAFYAECGRDILRRRLPEFFSRMAVGLVGEGSECFGFDDAVSRDHDWGPAFCVWLPAKELEASREPILAALCELPGEFRGHATRLNPPSPADRVGPLSIEGFYERFIGLPHPPRHWREWRIIPEHSLAVCVNGEVFEDAPGMFTSFRGALLAYYPEDVRLKKLAARCVDLAQAGQYNLPRMRCRGDADAALFCAARFAEKAVSCVFLLNRRYAPFYKWAARGARTLPQLGMEAGEMLDALARCRWTDPEDRERAQEAVEGFCAQVAAELRRQDLSDAGSDWLLEHAESVRTRITTPELREMPLPLE
ncbi:DUF4037 domain-containing protein [Desulfovibrio aminophilus]|uniref:DUF4037 domain-containing protein n=1 Tax=Desulfovibrio aminophilus TaxID=81425 RepID=UPI0033932C08